MTKDAFTSLVSEGAFLEHATFGGNMYGTTAKAVQAVSDTKGQRAILDIDAQGVKLLKANHAYLDPLYLFISPPNLRALYDRLRGRGTETPQSVLKRLSMAAGEMQYAREDDGKNFHVVVVNDDVERAYGLFKRAVREGADGQGWRGDEIPSGQGQEADEKAVLEQARKDAGES